MEFDITKVLNSLSDNFARILPLIGYVGLSLGIVLIGVSLFRFIAASESFNEQEKGSLSRQAIWLMIAGGLLVALTTTLAYFVGTFGFEANDLEGRIMRGEHDEGNDFLSAARIFVKIMFTIAGVAAVIRGIVFLHRASNNGQDVNWKSVMSHLIGGSLAIAHEDVTIALANSTSFKPLIDVVNAFWGTGP